MMNKISKELTEWVTKCRRCINSTTEFFKIKPEFLMEMHHWIGFSFSISNNPWGTIWTTTTTNHLRLPIADLLLIRFSIRICMSIFHFLDVFFLLFCVSVCVREFVWVNGLMYQKIFFYLHTIQWTLWLWKVYLSWCWWVLKYCIQAER